MFEIRSNYGTIHYVDVASVDLNVTIIKKMIVFTEHDNSDFVACSGGADLALLKIDIHVPLEKLDRLFFLT